MVFPLLILESRHGGRRRLGNILVSPGIGPLNRAPAREIGKLASPTQDLPSFVRRECPNHADERFFP
jgi:hypothetical protein